MTMYGEVSRPGRTAVEKFSALVVGGLSFAADAVPNTLAEAFVELVRPLPADEHERFSAHRKIKLSRKPTGTWNVHS
jgi:hypothetical protein